MTTLFWLPRLGDVYGQRKFFAYGMAAQALLFTIMMLTRDYYMMLISIFGSGMLYSIRQIMGFVYILELLPRKNRTLAVTVIYVTDALVYPSIVIYFWTISTNWFSLFLVAYCLSVIGAVACFYLPESPQFLIQLNQFDEALQVFRRIAKINGKLDKLN